MPFPRSRLDAYLVFKDTTLPPDYLYVQYEKWCLKGYITDRGRSGLNYQEFGFGSFQKLSVVQSDVSMLYANHQGGYRVFCPNNDKIVTVDFTNGVTKWRVEQNAPQDTKVYCSGCHHEHALVDFIGKPNFAFGRLAFHFVDIESSTLNETVHKEVESNIGCCSLVLKRVG